MEQQREIISYCPEGGCGHCESCLAREAGIPDTTREEKAKSHSTLQFLYVSICGNVRDAVSGILNVAKGLPSQVFGLKSYDLESSPGYVRKLHKAAGEPEIYYAGFLRRLGGKAVRILGLYDGKRIYLKPGSGNDVAVHEIMHVLQKHTGILGLLINPMYRAFIEGMANYFAIKYVQAHGGSIETLQRTYILETRIFEQIFNGSGIDVTYSDPEGIKNAMAKSANLYGQFKKAYLGHIKNVIAKYLSGKAYTQPANP